MTFHLHHNSKWLHHRHSFHIYIYICLLSTLWIDIDSKQIYICNKCLWTTCMLIASMTLNLELNKPHIQPCLLHTLTTHRNWQWGQQLLDNREIDFNYPISNFPFIRSTIPPVSSYGVHYIYISQWHVAYQDFCHRGFLKTWNHTYNETKGS
jgi:hypothetical protein